MELFMQDAF